jgi:hypothetical protein
VSDSRIADLVEQAADRIIACHAEGPWRVLVEVAVWQDCNGTYFMRQVAARIKERIGV